MDDKFDVRTIISRVLGCDPASLEPDSKYGVFPKWDSFAHLDLITEIETLFNIEISDQDIAKLDVVKDIQEYCNQFSVIN